MARARNIKPGFFQNDELVECSFAARLCFAGLWTLADREGRMEDRPKKIKMALFPADDVDTNELLDELHARNLIHRYEVDGNKLICIPKWHKHQRPHQNETASELPGPEAKEEGSTCDHGAKDFQPRGKALRSDTLNLIPDTGYQREGASAPPPPHQPASKSSGKGSRIADDFDLTGQRQDVARQQGLSDAEAQQEVEKFVDYWRSMPGQKGRKADWEATWRNWCRRASEFRGGRKKTADEPYMGDIL